MLLYSLPLLLRAAVIEQLSAYLTSSQGHPTRQVPSKVWHVC